jgi:hypothetical protein
MKMSHIVKVIGYVEMDVTTLRGKSARNMPHFPSQVRRLQAAERSLLNLCSC